MMDGSPRDGNSLILYQNFANSNVEFLKFMLKLHDFLDLYKKLFFWNKVTTHLTEKWEKIMQNITIFTMQMSRKLEVICVPLFIKFIRGDQYFPVS